MALAHRFSQMLVRIASQIRCMLQHGKHQSISLPYSFVCHMLWPCCCSLSCSSHKHYTVLTHSFLICVLQVSAAASETPRATIYIHGFTEILHLMSDSPQLHSSLQWAVAYQACLQLQGHALQCFAAEVLPVLMAHHVFGLDRSTEQVCVCPPSICMNTCYSRMLCTDVTTQWCYV